MIFNVYIRRRCLCNGCLKLIFVDNIITLGVKDLPYRKMTGLLKSQKINPDKIALKVEVDDEYTRFIVLKDWQNYLPFSHKVVRILLFKIRDVFLFVGHSTDNQTIIYNPEFSKMLLESKWEKEVKQLNDPVGKTKKRTYFTKRKITRIDVLLDKITRFGIDSLSGDEQKELDDLSNK